MFLCLGPVRSAASAPRREESADLQHRGQLRRRPDDTDGWRHREGYTGDSTPHIRSDTSIAEPPLSVCPLYQQSLDRRREGGGGGEGKKKYKNAAFSGVESRCRLRPKTADFDVSGSAEAGREGSSRAITRRITVCLPPTTTTVTAVFSPSVAESRSSARVDGSQLHMRRDPARSPIDRQRIASLQFPGFGARLARFVTSVSLWAVRLFVWHGGKNEIKRKKKRKNRHAHACEPWRVWASLLWEYIRPVNVHSKMGHTLKY